MSYSNKKINIRQVDVNFTEKCSLTGYSYNLVDINTYMFAPYIDYTSSANNIDVRPFKGIRAVTIGGGGGGGGSGHDSVVVVFYSNGVNGALTYRLRWGGTGGGGGCGQINHGVINDLYSTYGVNTFNVIVGAGGNGGVGGVATGTYDFNGPLNGSQGNTGGSSSIQIIDIFNNYYYPILSLGGGGGGGGRYGDIKEFTDMATTGNSEGGAAGTSYGWVNNPSYYCIKSTGGNKNDAKEVGSNTYYPSKIGGYGGVLNGWCNTILINNLKTSDFGKGGQGGYSNTHTNKTFSTIVFSGAMTALGYEYTDNGVAGQKGNDGFVRVYFNNVNNLIGVLNGNFSKMTPSPNMNNYVNSPTIENWVISSGTTIYGCSGITPFSPYNDDMTKNKPFKNFIAVSVSINSNNKYISQNFTLPNGSYVISFYAWPKSGSFYDGRLIIYINDSYIAPLGFNGNEPAKLYSYNFTVTTQDQKNELKFLFSSYFNIASTICIANISIYEYSQADNSILIFDGSLNNWINMGINTSSTIGNPTPSFKATRAYSYGYINVATINPSFNTFFNSRLTFDIYTTTGSLVNLYFGCDISGQGNMFRLDVRTGCRSGITSTTNWTQWEAPSSGPLGLLANTWYSIVITIDSLGAATFTYNGISFTTPYTISNSGTYIGIQADGINGGYIDNIFISNPTTMMVPPPVSPTSNTIQINNQIGELSFKNGTYTISSSSVYGGFEPYNAFNDNEADGSFWHSQGSGMTTGYPISSTTGIGAYTRDAYDINNNFVGGNTNTNSYWKTLISGTYYAGEWLQIKLPYSFILTSHTYVNRYSTWSQRGPKLFYVAGSNDGITWSMLHQKDYTNSSIPSTGRQNYTVSNNSNYYSYYRIVFNKVYGPTVNISEWRLFGYR